MAKPNPFILEVKVNGEVIKVVYPSKNAAMKARRDYNKRLAKS